MKEAESPVHCSQKGSHDVRHVIPFLFLAFLCLTSNKHTKSKLSLFKFSQYFPDAPRLFISSSSLRASCYSFGIMWCSP